MLLVGLLAAALTACDPVDPVDPVPSESPSPSASETATETPTATPTPTVEPFVIDCLSIIPQSRRDFITSFGWPAADPARFFAKNRASSFPFEPYNTMEDNGGVICPYAPGNEVVYAYGYAPLAAGEAAEVSAQIGAETGSNSYASSPYAGGTLYVSATDGNAFKYVLVVTDAIFVGADTDVIDEMVATIP